MTPFCQQIAKQMIAIPDKLCITDQLGNHLTFADVDRLTGQVFAYLRSKGIGRGDFVFINLPRGAMVYVAALGIIRAGAAFVVLEASAPAARAEYIKNDCNCKLTLNQQNWDEITRQKSIDSWAEGAPDDPLCAIYTSGTTGYTSNPSEVAVFDDYHGDYQILGDPHVGDTYASSFNSQITGVVRIPGQNLWVALADRWEPFSTETDLPRRTFEAKKEAYANYQPQPRKEGSQPKVVDRRYQLVDAAHAVYHAGYVFLPITFENGVPMTHWLAEWQLPQ